MKAEFNDLQAILDLQYEAYQSEAKLVNDFNIPPLKQTLDELITEYSEGIILKAVDENNKIIGSVRGYSDGVTFFIGKLIVHPCNQGKGVGTLLLKQIEKICTMSRYELFTSNKSIRNINLYERLGYKKFKENIVNSELTILYLEKYNETAD